MLRATQMVTQEKIEQGAPVLIDGKRFPLVGRVSMDLICVEIKKLENRTWRYRNFMGRVAPGRRDSAIGEDYPLYVTDKNLEGLDASF